MTLYRAYRIEQAADGKGVAAGFAQMDADAFDAGDVTVRLQYAGVNYKDALAASGKGKIIRRFPCVGGIDAAGVVESSTSPRFAPGDAVVVHGHGFGVSHHGGFAQWARVPAEWVNKLPAGISTLDAATIGVAGYTAALAVEFMEACGATPARGPAVVTGATGGVGSIAIDLLARRGYEVTAATAKPAEAAYLRDLGAVAVIATGELDVGPRPLESARWAAAVDNVGGKPLEALTRTMMKDGVIAAIGNAAGIELHTTVMPFILRGVRLVGVNSDNDVPTRERAWARLATDLRPRHLAGIRTVRPFEALPSVVEELIAGRHKGRTVIELDT